MCRANYNITYKYLGIINVLKKVYFQIKTHFSNRKKILKFFLGSWMIYGFINLLKFQLKQIFRQAKLFRKALQNFKIEKNNNLTKILSLKLIILSLYLNLFMKILVFELLIILSILGAYMLLVKIRKIINNIHVASREIKFKSIIN